MQNIEAKKLVIQQKCNPQHKNETNNNSTKAQCTTHKQISP